MLKSVERPRHTDGRHVSTRHRALPNRKIFFNGGNGMDPALSSEALCEIEQE